MQGKIIMYREWLNWFILNKCLPFLKVKKDSCVHQTMYDIYQCFSKRTVCFCLLTGLIANMVELASLDMIELVTSAWTWLSTCLFMHAKTDCSWLDERTDLNNVFGTIMMNQWHAWYNSDEITRLNSDVTTTMNLVVTSSRILHGGLTYANNPCRLAKLYIQYVETWLNNTVILPILSCSFMSTVLLRGFEPTTL